jgi:hypothetical protein
VLMVLKKGPCGIWKAYLAQCATDRTTRRLRTGAGLQGKGGLRRFAAHSRVISR